MNVLVTGSDGFIGKNLIERLARLDNVDIIKFNRNNNISDLNSDIDNIDFIFHLAGVNRPKEKKEFYIGNGELTEDLINLLIKSNRFIPILLPSSTHANTTNDYGKSKLISENCIRSYSVDNNVPVFIYRLPGIFGKWCRPNYNSVIATWCYRIARGEPIEITNKDQELELVYIDDVVDSFVEKLDEKKANFNCLVDNVYTESLGQISSLLLDFRESRDTGLISKIGAGFTRVLYATYLSYLPTDKFSYNLQGHSDNRGDFYEVLRTVDSGQLSISTTKPGDAVRGNHYHNTKNEKFLVLKGSAEINLRCLNSDKVVSYSVSDKKMQVVEMIPGYTHNIKNTSKDDMVLLIWANENYNPDKPDTYFLDV
jgi:UDP-2-acetamido-2,6-beta-L-arabino-hexul-4-ose reductase